MGETLAPLAARLARLDALPADPVVFATVRELAASDRWKEGLDRSRAAIRAGIDRDRVLAALAAGALDHGRPDRALKALAQVSDEGLSTGEGLALRVRALAATGELALARRMVDARRLEAPDDTAADALAAELTAPSGLRGALPLETERHVRALLAHGYGARALRLLRRLRLQHPEHADDLAVRQLAAACAVAVRDAGDGLDDVLKGFPLPELDDDEALLT